MEKTDALKPMISKGSEAALGINHKLLSPANAKKAIHLTPAHRQWLTLQAHRMLWGLGPAAREGFRTYLKCGFDALPAERSGKKTGNPGYPAIGWYGSVNAIKTDGRERLNFGYKYLVRCGNPFWCPDCGPKLRAARSTNEVVPVVEKMVKAGYIPVFITLTAPHSVETDPEIFMDALSRASTALRSGKYWKEHYADRYQYIGQISALELTDDSPTARVKTGAHIHFHCLYFFGARDVRENIDDIRGYLKRRWLESIQKYGIEVKDSDAAYKNACNIQLLRSRKKGAEHQAVAQYLAKIAGSELAPGALVKAGRTANRINQFELLALAATRRPDLAPRVLELMKATRGRPWLRFSPGLLEFCDIQAKSDKEILESDDPTKNLYIFDDNRWNYWIQICQYGGLKRELLEYLDQKGEVWEDSDGKQRLNDAPIRLIAEDGCHPATGEELGDRYEVEPYLQANFEDATFLKEDTAGESRPWGQFEDTEKLQNLRERKKQAAVRASAQRRKRKAEFEKARIEQSDKEYKEHIIDCFGSVENYQWISKRWNDEEAWQLFYKPDFVAPSPPPPAPVQLSLFGGEL